MLHQQVERLLKGQRGRRFIEDFAGQWLDLVDIDFTEPDRKLYGDFDIVVQYALSWSIVTVGSSDPKIIMATPC